MVSTMYSPPKRTRTRLGDDSMCGKGNGNGVRVTTLMVAAGQEERRRSEREEDGEAPGRRWLTDCEGRCRSFGQWLARSNTARLRRRDHVESGRDTRGARKHTCNTNARLAPIAFLSLTAA